jgi:hypothetical protein
MSIFEAYPTVGAVGLKVYRLTKRRDDKVEGRNVYFRVRHYSHYFLKMSSFETLLLSTFA